MTREEFEKLTVEALDSLPENIRAKMDNVAVVIEDWPSAEQLKKGGTRRGDLLFGLYEGVPLTGRGINYNLVLPDKITIFQGPMEQVFSSPEDIKKEVAQTVWHEIAHHFGFDERGVAKLARKKRG